MAPDVRRLLLAYAALNAVLYSLLLPLWEGFDEPFHFAYVQQLANGQGLPDARTARLSREVWDSILLAPASDPVKSNLPEVVTYSEYFSWPLERRIRVQQSLREIPRSDRWELSDAGNYEAHHPPLAYVLLAIPERLLAGTSLPFRVLVLRFLAASIGTALLFSATAALCEELSLSGTHTNAVLFCVLSMQMTWATLAHVANDWLAVPLAVWMLVFMMRTRFVAGALMLATGLLTKAYFLALVPVLLGVAVVRGKLRGALISVAVMGVCAGPWYLRNYLRYHVITGMQEARAGIGPLQVFHSAFALNWPAVVLTSIRAALWTANNTFRSFSLGTMNGVLAVCAAAFLLWLFSRHAPLEWVVAAYGAAFALAIAYATVVVYIRTGNPLSTPSAWYAQVLMAPVFALLFLGTARHRRPGRLVAIATTLLSGYLLAATYFVKLIPLYAGYEGRGTPGGLAAEYFLRIRALEANLNSVALGPATLIVVLAFVVVALAAVMEILIIRGILVCTKSSSYSVPDRKPSSSAPSC